MAACALLALGMLISPRPPSVDEIDPAKLYASVKRNANCLPGDVTLPNPRTVMPLVEGEDRIAGRDTWVLRLNPKTKPSPWLQLWVDKRTKSVVAYRQWSGEDVLIRSEKISSNPTRTP